MRPLHALCVLFLWLLAASALAQAPDVAAALNGLRAQAAQCPGGALPAAAALALDPRLTQAAASINGAAQSSQIDLNAVLDRAGYHARKSIVLRVSGTGNAATLATYVEKSFCDALHAAEYSELGVHQFMAGNQTHLLILLAQPVNLPRATANSQSEAGARVLALTNQARGTARLCGQRNFGPAPPLAWDARLAQASAAHATDMAKYKYFSHTGRDGVQADVRVQRAGFAWRAVGENIAAGQATPEEVVASWIASPEHCANLMSPAFRMMGTAYAVNPDSRMGIYWVQVFGTPR